MRFNPLPALAVTVAACALSFAGGQAKAHGLLMRLRAEGGTLLGKVSYTNGEAGADQYVEMTDLSTPGAKAVSGKTDAAGDFRFSGIAGHRYRVLTEGEEGHQTEMQITLGEETKGAFIDRDGMKKPFWTPPAWLVLAGLLALSLVPALWLRRKRGSRDNT